jgi:hypothetical protein
MDGDYKQVKGWLDDLTDNAARMDVVDSPPMPPARLYGPGITKERGIASAIGYVQKVRRWGVSLLPRVDLPEAGSGEQPGNATSSGQVPSEGTKFREEDTPALFREGGKPGAAVLTATYLKVSENWFLKGSYLTKHYGPGKELTTHIKVGRAKAYLYAEMLVLRDRKTANEASREERH